MTDEPRIQPVQDELEGLAPLNIFRTLAKHPDLLKSFSRFGGTLLYKGIIPPREREIVILRVGWRCGSVYEFGQHTVMGQQAGLTLQEVERLAEEGRDGWSEQDRNLVDFADELCADNTISDDLWARVAAQYSEPQLLELLVLAGFYRLVSGLLRATGVQLEDGTPGWPVK